MSDRGLLRKAQEIRSNPAKNGTDSLDFSLDSSSGISAEDQKDILLHIDRVAQSSRILAGPDTWKVRARKRGFGVPLFVNLIAAAVLAGGLFALWKMFSVPEAAESASGVAISTAEGRLLKEIRREAEGRILEKDREISAIQEKMAALDKEKSQLLSGIEDRVKAKEAELRRLLSEELEKERQRLVAAGLTASTIEERLKAFEKEKTEALRRELDEFSRKADAERLALQNNLDKARAEYQQSLQDVTSERQRILDESRKREQELRSQLDAKNKALEDERARTAESLKDTQAELARMNEDVVRSQAAEDRLFGMYSAARKALQEGRVEDAARSAESLRQYLSEPYIATLPGLSRRRDSDLFTVDLVEQVVSAERSRTAADTTKITDALSAMGRIRETAAQAQAARDAGDLSGAEALYRRMFSALPELEMAQAFLDAESAGRNDGVRRVQQTAVDAAYKVMDSAYALRDWPGVDRAFRDLMTALSLDEDRLVATLRRIKESGGAAAFAAKKAAETNGAAGPMRNAEADLAEGRLAEAIQGYASILARFPDAEQTPQALEGLRKASRQLASSFQEYRDTAQKRVDSLEAEVATLQSSLDTQADRTARFGSTGTTAADYAALREEKERIEAALAVSDRRYASLQAAYESFVADEAAILSSGGPQALVAGRSRMDEFFTNDAIVAVLPGMRERLSRYLAAYQAAGEKEVLFNAADIVEGAARIRDADVRERYFKDMETRYSGNETMMGFLKTLRDILK